MELIDKYRRALELSEIATSDPTAEAEIEAVANEKLIGHSWIANYQGLSQQCGLFR